MKLREAVPVRKVGAGALAGASTVILVWGVGFAGLDVPAPVASSITTIFTFGVSWLVPSEAL